MYCGLGPEELVLVAAILSIYIAKDRTTDELNVLGNLFVGIGSNLLIIAAFPQSPSTTNSKDNNSESSTNPGDNNSESSTNSENNNSK
jgi:hypothetical protein